MKPKFEVTIYSDKKTPRSSLIFGFQNFEDVAALYPTENNFSVLNIETGEYRAYTAHSKNIGVFF